MRISRNEESFFCFDTSSNLIIGNFAWADLDKKYNLYKPVYFCLNLIIVHHGQKFPLNNEK